MASAYADLGDKTAPPPGWNADTNARSLVHSSCGSAVRIAARGSALRRPNRARRISAGTRAPRIATTGSLFAGPPSRRAPTIGCLPVHRGQTCALVHASPNRVALQPPVSPRRRIPQLVYSGGGLSDRTRCMRTPMSFQRRTSAPSAAADSSCGGSQYANHFVLRMMESSCSFGEDTLWPVLG